MRYFGLHILSLFLLGLVLVQCGEPYIIEESGTSRILQTLSADDMRGRQTLTPEIEKAQNFIASEFKKARLKTFEGLDNYLQEFYLTETSIVSSEVVINGNVLPATRYFASISVDSITWNNSSASIRTITTTDDFRNKHREYSSSNEDLVVFVDQAHEELFSRYRNFFSRPSRSMDEKDQKANVIFVLSGKPSDFHINITAETTEKKLSNIVGVIEGKRKDEYVLFSAHHDHLGIRNVTQGDSIANGANDNASGVTAVIELANYFKSLGKPERTLVFVTYTAEEMGGYGSKYFSQQLNPDEIVAMFNIEMIGKPAVSGPNSAWITGYDLSTFGELLSKSAEGTIYEFYADPYPQQNLFYRSDNATLARLGVPAHTISTTPIDVDTDYHEVSDEFDTIDIAHLTNTIKAIAKAAEGIVSGADTPTRVNTDLVN